MDLSKVADLKRAIRESLDRPSPRVLSNPGEGIAILRPAAGKGILHNVAFVEGVHFDLGYTTAAEVGHRCLAIALNRLAALGARARQGSIGVGLKQDQGEIFVAELYQGAAQLSRGFGVDLVAEHTFPSPSFLIVTVTVLGEPIPRGKLLPQDKATRRDLLCVTGYPGASACGLALLRRLGRADADRHPEARDAHLRPHPRLVAGERLAKLDGITSVIELRNGLARDLDELVDRNGNGVVVTQDLLPMAPFMKKAAEFLGSDPLTWVLYGGEDTELLFTVRPARFQTVERALSTRSIPVHVIGQMDNPRSRVRLREPGGEIVPLPPMVWTDYARRARRAS